MDPSFKASKQSVLYTLQHNVFDVAYGHCIALQSASKVAEYEGCHTSSYEYSQNVGDDHSDTHQTHTHTVYS
jgi:hypothetical protein